MGLFNDYIGKAKLLDSKSSLTELNSQYDTLMTESLSEADEKKLWNNIHDLTAHLVNCREMLYKADTRNMALSDSERVENSKIQQLLDENLFCYHFQPIVRADNGEIYAYEALMRANGMQGITPYHILKYAELTNRLADVEQYTFLNVLRYIDANKELFAGKPVFINSMPNVHILPQKAHEIEKLLENRSDNIVVEMIENTQFMDNELNEIKDRYRKLGIPIAIDDFGTGYSNISNLLRYTPNFVKIDRSLLSGIESSPNKKHFVREIIDFCHDNGIMALAEGVESSEELRTVILLGVDLIQGYYTAKPSAEVVSEIPYEKRNEIRSHRQEHEDGRRLKIYTAESGERISLERLTKDGYSCIHIGSGFQKGSVTVAGSQHFETGIHIITADGFKGEITLENARLSNLAERPCIDIGNDCAVALNLVGTNKLNKSGIRVPENSSLSTSGDGSLDIRLTRADYYGIGNDLRSKHGMLIFDQDGTISITAESHAGVCIGSGLGGTIYIKRGRYVLNSLGSLSVCVGSVDGPSKIEMLGCDFEGTASGAYSMVAGSMYNDCEVHMMYSSIKCISNGQLAVCIGSLNGSSTKIFAESVNLSTALSAESLTAFGSINGGSEISVKRSSVKITADGEKALAFGSDSGKTKLYMRDADLSGELSTGLDAILIADNDDIDVAGGRCKITVNGKKMSII